MTRSRKSIINGTNHVSRSKPDLQKARDTGVFEGIIVSGDAGKINNSPSRYLMELIRSECVILRGGSTKMNQMILRSWREQKIMLKRRFPILSDEDFAYEEGKKETMLKRLEAKLNKSATELESLFAELQLY